MASTPGRFAAFRSRSVRLVTAVALVAAGIVVPTVLLVAPSDAATNPCTAPVASPVACENTQPGTPDWQVNTDDPTIAGFTTDISGTAGSSMQFKVNTTASSYDIFVFRLGYYQGIGARQVADLPVRTRTTQPACKQDAPTGMTDCGNWAVTATWNVPSTAVSGVYYAVFHRNDTGGENEAAFVLRNDTSHSAILFQTSDETWEAYNSYGGQSLYTGAGPGANGASYAVSYNRPLSGEGDENFIFNAEVPMLYFLEQQGYDVSYTTDVDSARRGNLITNHKVFMTVGHDEYWSNEQRANVQAALNAGVSGAFLTGNDVFWKTRFTNSIDGSNTAWRSVTVYKETLASKHIDPTLTWTGTWRDPRFSPPSDGGRPENSMLGQMFQMNGYRSDSLQVPAAYGKMRLWRGTSLATMAAGATYSFQPGTLGYEWDTVQDNGSQPAGVAELSKTTVTTDGNYVLNNYGDLFLPGTLTHNLTMYRNPTSHSLVFAAGTVQWAWGLANDHAFQTDTPTSDVRMQQATINLMADMGVQPVTVSTGLTTATASTDTTAPKVAIISSPAPVVGANYTFSGTVSDVGGQVAGVEASSDGGKTWHYATWTAGTGTWSYGFVPAATGSVTIEVRAVDDSANLSSAVVATLTVGPRSCPCGVFANSSVPGTASTADSSNLELGMKFQSAQSGYVTGVRFYKGTGNTGTHTGTLWSATGTKLASGTFTNETATGWQSMTFARSVPIQADTTYVVSYHAPVGHYAGDSGYFTNGPAVLQPMTGMQSTTDSPNGVFSVGATTTFPTDTFGNTNYWVDATFNTTPAPNIQPPNVLANNPANGTGSVTLNPAVNITFDEPVVQSSLQFTLKNAAGTAVTGSTTLSADRTTATFTPSAALAASTTYTASAKATDDSGNVMPTAFTWSFTTGKPRPATCPCTIWDDFTTPAIADSGDPGAVVVGTKVRFDAKGQITGMRFYKGPGNTGTHVGTLYSSTGTKLASGTFTGETANGWQTLTFAAPVNVNANTTYVAAYLAPNGHYSVSPGYFGTTATYNQLHAIADGVDGGNGVYAYSATSVMPTNTYNANNYWVDVLWQQGANGDATPPTVSTVTPANASTGAALAVHPAATMSEAVDLGSATFTVTDPGGAAIGGSTTLSTDQKTLTFTPSAPLAPGTVYQASVRVADVNGNLMSAPTTWTFTTTTTQACPCSMFSAATVPTVVSTADPNPYELGVRFTPSADGTITGVRFYKSQQNTGVHTGSLYSSTGTKLATGTFANETASGWQTLTFASPVAVTAGTTYVASYTTTTGFYSGDNGYFNRSGVNTPLLSAPANATGSPNGVFSVGSGFPTDSFGGSNYWVDVLFKN